MRLFFRSNFISAGAAVVAVAGTVFTRAALVTGASAREPRAQISLDSDAAAAHLATAIRFRTVSTRQSATDTAAYLGFNEYPKSAYPLVHRRLRRETIGGQSLLYERKGKDAAEAPIVLIGHTDVVPVIPGSESRRTSEIQRRQQKSYTPRA
jgi:hypothetical protein